MTYYTEEETALMKARALEDARRTDDLWSFIHSTLIDIVESQDGKHVSGGDGFFKMPRGKFDVNTAAEHLQVALEERARFLQERAENDKSG
jgi:hypothetical protein